jgi:1,4-alpha-glucan branching enzyme
MAQERMTELVHRFGKGAVNNLATPPGASQPDSLRERALKQAGRQLLLAQSSDWPFILRTGTSPGYARTRVIAHLLRFSKIYEQFQNSQIDEAWLAQIESQDNIFPALNYRYFG